MTTDSKPYLVGIAGPSCAGKTELSRHLARLLSATILPLDCYYFDLSHLPPEERARNNFDIPTALDHDLFLQHLEALNRGEEIARPVYDFARHCRSGQVEIVEPGRYIIVEGLFVLYWEDVRNTFGTRVFVDLDDKSCLDRRIVRDVEERGRTPESVIWQFTETVRPMAERYIRPTKQFADVVVRGDCPIEASVAAVMGHVDRNSRRRAAANPAS
ncbi:MAG: uridine kinase [Terriglobales bacterium]